MSHHAPHVLKFTAGKRTVAAQLPSLILSWGKLPTSRAQCPSPLPETLHTPRITARRRPSRSALSAGALRGSPEPSGDRQLSESLRSLRRRTGEQRLPTRRPVSVASKEALWTLFLTPVACCCRCPSLIQCRPRRHSAMELFERTAFTQQQEGHPRASHSRPRQIAGADPVAARKRRRPRHRPRPRAAE